MDVHGNRGSFSQCPAAAAIRFGRLLDGRKIGHALRHAPSSSHQLIDAFINALAKAGVPLRVLSQSEHALGEGQEASAIAYIQVRLASGAVRWGAGVDTSIELASIKAVFSALNS